MVLGEDFGGDYSSCAFDVVIEKFGDDIVYEVAVKSVVAAGNVVHMNVDSVFFESVSKLSRVNGGNELICAAVEN